MAGEDTPNVAIWPQGVPGVERNFYWCLPQNRNPRVYHVATFGGHMATLGVPIWPHLVCPYGHTFYIPCQDLSSCWYAC